MRHLAAVLAMVALIGPVGFSLLAPGAADRSRPLNDPDGRVDVRAERPLTAINLWQSQDVPDRSKFELELRVSDPQLVCRSSFLSLKLGTHFKRVDIERAVVEGASGSCRFEFGPTTIDDNAMIILRRVESGFPVADSTLRLSISAKAVEGLALWAIQGRWPDALLCIPPSETSCTTVPFGEIGPSEAGPGQMTRADLLAHVWSMQSTLPIWVSLFVAGGFLAAAVLNWPYRPAMSPSLAFLGFALAHAVITPPFHAPDEPDHTLSVLRYLSLQELEPGFLALAQAGHFERLKFRAAEKFTAADVDRVIDAPWSTEITPPHAAERSGLATIMLRPWRSAIGLLTPGRSVLALRVGNALFAALCFALGGWLLGQGTAKVDIAAASAPLLAVPTLPFFAMHVSNYAWLTAFSILLALSTGAALRESIVNRSTLLIAGGALGGLFLSGASGVAAAPILTILVLSPALIPVGDRDHTTMRDAAVKALWLIAPPTLAMAVAAPEYVDAIVARGKAKLGVESVAAAKLVLISATVLLTTLYGIVGSLIFGAVMRTTRGRRLLGRPAAAGMCLVLVGLCLRAAVKDVVPLPGREVFPSLTAVTYGVLTLKKFSAVLALGQPDFYLSHSFWSGFGWLETLLSPRVTLGLRTIAIVGPAAWLAIVAVRPGPSDPARVLRLLAGSALVLVLLVNVAVAAWTLPVHGRYLICFYTVYLTIAAWGAQNAIERSPLGPRMRRMIAVALCALLPIGIHATALLTVVNRYF